MTKTTKSTKSTKEKIQLDVALANPVLLNNKCQTVYLRIGLTGFHRQAKKEPLVPLNLALVIDTSMSAEKIAQAKEMAMMILTRLRPTDRIAIVACDYQNKVLLPATKARAQKKIIKAIETLTENGGAALFEGIEKGVTEMLKSRRAYQINRMILLSDGLSHMRAILPTQVNEFNRVLSEKNIAITTIGFGANYHRDLLMQLSQQTDGNHASVENAADMTRIVEQEFAELASIVAQGINVTLTCDKQVPLIKVLSQKAKVKEQTVTVQLKQLHSEQEEEILIELEIFPLPIPKLRKQTFAKLTVTYRTETHYCQRATKKISAALTKSQPRVAENLNASIITAVAKQLATEEAQLMWLLCDQYQIQGPKQLSLF